MNSDDFNELIGIFVAETQEFLQALETNLLAMESSTNAEARLQAVKNLFRAAHSIKGSALMFGFKSLSEAAHTLEDCFAILRDHADLSQLNPSTITALLQGVDHLKTLANSASQGEVASQQDSTSQSAEQAIAQIKTQLEDQYGKQTQPTLATINAPVSLPVVQAIFEKELLPVFNHLETELSQAQAETLNQTITALNEIYYQLSGVAGMLQLSEFAQIAEHLRALIDAPELSVEQLQQLGWGIAQNLQTARMQVLQGETVTVQPFALPSEDKAEEGNEEDKEELNSYSPTPPLPHSPTLPSPTVASPAGWQRPTIRVDLERLTELVNLVGELVINRTNLEVQEVQLRSEAKRIRKSISALHQFGTQLREEYDRLSVGDLDDGLNGRLKVKRLKLEGLRSNLQPANFQPSTLKGFDPLELDQYSEFHSTAQSVIETTEVIAQSGSKIDELALQFERSTDQLRRITEQLRLRVMQLRVVPFSRAVDHLPRALRELCRAHNKDVNLLLLGRETTIDESLLDALRDPLVHLVRNAFDHGIEPPEVRVAAGKPASGQIEIEARHQGGQTIITITDDGRGIDPTIIQAKAVAKGFVTAEQANDLSIADLYEFLFWPGFSTADEVTNLSGRGVGLDVVRTNLRQIRGSVKVDSRLGKGTSFILKLPLMLSITDALLVKVDHNTVAVPLDAVEEILHIQSHQIQTAGTQPMLRWREEFIRLVRLQELLHYSIPHPDGPSPDPIAQEHIPVMVLAASEGVMAIAVERIIGQQEIVVKALPLPLSKPRGIVGSTILGDGRVVTILDVDDLIGQFYAQSGTAISLDNKSEPGGRNGSSLLAPTPSSQPHILVVDDSYTIRHLLSLTLTRARYQVAQAKDGQDAITKLEQGLQCDLIIADIEMPRMDGFELLQALKANPKFAPIPVAMLTSRSGFKHRQMATELGAAKYFTKPYSEAQLLEAITKLLQTTNNHSS